MADPHICDELDKLDTLIVILYRLALTGAAIVLSVIPWQEAAATTALIITSLIAATTVHIYDKRFRFLILSCGIFAAIWQLSGLWSPLASGAALSVFSALALKEYFCFKIKLLLITPLVLAVYWFGNVYQQTNISMAFGITGALMLSVMAFLKWRMPIHYDIGNKSFYQI